MKKNMIVLFVTMMFFMLFSNETIGAQENIDLENENLGYIYSNSSTEFRIWSSSASEIEIVVEGSVTKSQTLTKDPNTNVWVGFIDGNISGCEYYYNISYDDGTVFQQVLDPYGKYLNLEGNKNVVFNKSVSMFEEWENVKNTLNIKDKNKIIYGLDVTTFTKSNTWSGLEDYRSRLLSLNYPGTSYNGVSTGYDYIKNLGVTYVEISNIINEKNPFIIDNGFVTGQNSYSGNIELKQVVKSYHNNNIGIILSIDLNKIINSTHENLKKIDKVYYETSDSLYSKKMVEMYLKNIVIHWVNEYKLAGIKFENMNLLSIDFLNDLSEKLKAINNDILVYGHGNYEIENENQVSEYNLVDLENVKMLNGSYNYSLFGDLYKKEERGILDGNYSADIIETLKFTLLSSVDNGEIDYSLVKGVSYKNYWGNKSSFQLINNLGTRDGLSVYDKIRINNVTINNKIIEQKMVLAFGTMMISGGIPYIEAGNEFMASYQDFEDNETSLCSDSSSNPVCFYTNTENKIMDWSSVYENSSLIDAFKSMVNFRKSDQIFVQTNVEAIEKVVDIYVGENGNIGYVRKYPNAYVNETEKVLVIFNYSNNDYVIDDFTGKGWEKSYQYNLANREGNKINSKANSIYFAEKTRPHKVNQWIVLIIVLGIIGGLYYLNIFLNRKLVETKGYDIKDISRKYRPFIKKKKETKKDEEKITDIFQEEKQEILKSDEFIEEETNDENIE